MAHPKNDLIERAQKLGLKRPEFQTDKSGPEHGPSFKAAVRLDGKVIGRGEGASKRAAEAAAAEVALATLASQAAGSDVQKDSDPKGGGEKQPAKKAAAKKAPAAAKQPAAAKEPVPPKPSASAKQPAATKKPAKAPAAEPARKPAAGEQKKPSSPPAVAADSADEPFDGPWPMFDDLLAATLQVADRRVDANVKGEAALSAVRDFSLRLYRELLLGLGEIVEDDDDEEDG